MGSYWGGEDNGRLMLWDLHWDTHTPKATYQVWYFEHNEIYLQRNMLWKVWAVGKNVSYLWIVKEKKQHNFSKVEKVIIHILWPFVCMCKLTLDTELTQQHRQWMKIVPLISFTANLQDIISHHHIFLNCSSGKYKLAKIQNAALKIYWARHFFFLFIFPPLLRSDVGYEFSLKNKQNLPNPSFLPRI